MSLHPIFQKIFEPYLPEKSATLRQPDCDICSSCGEHTGFEETDVGCVSDCCGAKPYDTDYENEYDR